MTWRSVPLRAIYRRVEERGRPDLPPLSVYRDLGVVPREGRTDNNNKLSDDLTAYKVVRPGDLVLNKMKTWQGSIGVSDYEGIVSPAYFIGRRIAEVESRYMHHLLRSAPLIAEYGARSKGIRPSQWDLPWEEFTSIRVSLPPLGSRRAIADYLDAETARIDALIEKKRQMVELLEERQRAFRIRAVLGEKEPRTDKPSPSGIYGNTPSGWVETPLRHVRCQVQTGPFGSQLHAEDYVEDGWPVVNPMNLKEGSIIPNSEMTITESKRTELSRHILRCGDIVFGRRGEMGRVGLVGPAEAGWLCGTGSLRLRLVGDYLDPAYLKLLLGTPPAKAYFELASVGSTMDNLNSEIVLDFPTLVPPMDRQHQIITDVVAMERTVLTLRTKAANQIHLLAERRQALIAAAVTGDLTVPGVAA